MKAELNYGIKLLADLIDWKETVAKDSLKHINDYHYRPQRKKSGGIRKIYAPHKKMRTLQRAILKKFFYRIPLINGQTIMGAVPKHSYVDNARLHCSSKQGRFFLRLDLKNAFPSINADYLKAMLMDIFVNEIKRVQGERILKFQTSGLEVDSANLPFKPLFPWAKVKWFRKLIGQNNPNLFSVLEQFLDLLVSIITYKGTMVQGIPTSPWLLNLIVAYSGVLDKLKNYLKEQGIGIMQEETVQPVVSLYIDDFIISSRQAITWQQKCQIAKIIETVPVFTINRRKTIYSNRSRIAPLIAGLRIVEMPDQNLEKHLAVTEIIAGSLGISESRKKKILARREKELKQKTHLEARLPKKMIRKIRGIIHWASYGLENYQALKNTVRGYMANLGPIYGKKLPNQILKPFGGYIKYQRQTKA